MRHRYLSFLAGLAMAMVKGAGSIPAALGGGEVNIKLSEVSTGIGFGWRF